MLDQLTRRHLLGTAAALLTPSVMPQSAAAAGAPNSSGTEPPKSKAPAKACDAHFHIIDAKFPPPDTRKPGGMTVADYRLLQARIGTTRAVPVQPKNHRMDHACLLDAIARLGIENARGIAVIDPGVDETELKRLHAGGIRGVRFSVWNPHDAVVSIDMIEPVARRIAPFGWHIQLHASGDQIVEQSALLNRLPCPIVFDHMARLPPRTGPDHPAFKVVVDLVQKDRGWVKLAGAYLNTETGPPDYADATRIAQGFAKAVPNRLVWGSDWPHTTETTHKPDDSALFDLLSTWATNEAIRTMVLVDNPAKLYGFS